MKKIIVSVLMLAVSAMTASAQLQTVGTFAFEPHFGLGYTSAVGLYATQVSTMGYIEEIPGGISVEIGADLVYKHNDRFSFSSGLNYFTLTTDEADDEKYEINTVDIPFLARYDFTKNFSAFAGLRFSLPLTFKFNSKGERINMKDDIKTGTRLPLGVRWTFDTKLFISAQYQISLKELNKNERLDDEGKNLHNIELSPFILNIGYRFDL